MAFRHRLMPLLYINLNSICSEKVPADVLKNLKESFHENTHKNLLLTGELVRIMKLLKESGINVLTYKGPVLAHSAYGNIGYRQFGDIDILTDKAGAQKAKELMNSNGYDLYQHIKADDSTYMKLESEFIFINKNTMQKVEINWNFAGNFFYIPNNSNKLFNKLKIIKIHEFKFYTFNPVNQLLALCIHTAKHNWDRIIWIADINQVILTENFDWNIVLKKAEKIGVKRILLINLFLANLIFELNLPKIIFSEFNKDLTVKKISNQIINRIFIQHKEMINFQSKIFLYIKRRENLKEKLIESLNILTKPNYEDYATIPLPNAFFSLYMFIRPLLILTRI